MKFKNVALSLMLGCSAIVFSCSSAGSDHDNATTEATTDTVAKKDFSNIAFATKKDTSCGMPLTAGVEDTLNYDGKVYGFCSKECKNAFVAQLHKEGKM